MADKLTAAKQTKHLGNVETSIVQAKSAAVSLYQKLFDVNSHWGEYVKVEDDTDALAAAGAQFVTDVTAAWTDAKPQLEGALDILAGGSNTTRNALLDSMKTAE